jgi:hypothetical protein
LHAARFVGVHPLFDAGAEFRPVPLPIGNDQDIELFYNYAVTGILLTAPSRAG